MIVFIFLSFHFFEEFMNGIRDIVSNRRRKLATLFLLMIIIAAFTMKPGIHLLKSTKNIITLEQVNPYREIAEQIKTIEFPAPYAIVRSAQKNHTDYYIAYYLKKQFSGRPLSADVESITNECKSVDAKSLVVFDNLELVERLKSDIRYVYIASQKLKKDKRYLYAPNIEQDEISGWDQEVNIFAVK